MDEDDDEEIFTLCEDSASMEIGTAMDQLLEGATAYPIAEFNSTIGEENKLARPVVENGRFKNPWKACSRVTLTHLFKAFFWARDESCIPRREELDHTLPVLQPDMTEFCEAPISGIRQMWIGHASSLVQFDGVTFLTDPIFSDRCSPVQFVGIKRYRPPPCSVHELPHIDFVLISHSHYDHLDHSSVAALNERYGIGLRWYVPMGLKKWMNDCGCSNVVEMTWWEEDTFSENLNVTVACTPSQHWSWRTVGDENKVLWCSWCVIGPKHNFYFCGDSGYNTEAFNQIGRRYGPFTLANIPIGAYSPRDVLIEMHSDPESAIKIHEDIKSETSIGIHWGTFALTSEHYLEPQEFLLEELQAKKMKPSSFVTVKHGEIVLIGCDHYDEVD